MDDDGVPLGHYLEHAGCGVRVACLDCQLGQTFGVAAVIARLEARGVGGAATGIRALAGLVVDPCPRCGGRRFETRPAFGGHSGGGGFVG